MITIIMFTWQTGVAVITTISITNLITYITITNLITYIIIITITQDFIMDIGQIEKTWWWRRLKQQVLVVFSVVMSAW